ncbi:MAG TPA: Crp/Fnr family transcriptional regulator [Flavobacteriales bacterium]|nr:Crp/Fnr family transcriptional regulator [Flavobacteriales bacterium]HIO66997.1 Crp/Fnr family transcriptional regulator [Flavobacteriales bacterium]
MLSKATVDKKASPALMKVITNFVVFHSCSARDLGKHFRDSEQVELEVGEILYKQGDKPQGVFLIESGSLKVVRSLSDGQRIVIKLVNKRSLSGLEALLSEEKYQDTAYANDKVRAYLLNGSAFLSLIFTNKQSYDGVIELMNKDLISARSRIISLSQKRAKQRLAESILWIGDFFGTDEDKRIKYLLRPKELATISGTTLSNLYKLLAFFESLGFISYKHNNLQLMEPKKLLQFANADLSNRLK